MFKIHGSLFAMLEEHVLVELYSQRSYLKGAGNRIELIFNERFSMDPPKMEILDTQFHCNYVLRHRIETIKKLLHTYYSIVKIT